LNRVPMEKIYLEMNHAACWNCEFTW
jgi:hypothetical protein